MNYADEDQAAAIADLIAFAGTMIEIGGIKSRAYVQPGNQTQTASEFGLDNRENEITATIVNRRPAPSFFDSVLYKGQRYRITQMEPTGEKVLTLTCIND